MIFQYACVRYIDHIYPVTLSALLLLLHTISFSQLVPLPFSSLYFQSSNDVIMISYKSLANIIYGSISNLTVALPLKILIPLLETMNYCLWYLRENNWTPPLFPAVFSLPCWGDRNAHEWLNIQPSLIISTFTSCMLCNNYPLQKDASLMIWALWICFITIG